MGVGVGVGVSVGVGVGQYKVLSEFNPAIIIGHSALAIKSGTIPSYPKYCSANT